MDPNKITILVGSIAQDVRKKKFVNLAVTMPKLSDIISIFGLEATIKALGELIEFEGGD